MDATTSDLKLFTCDAHKDYWVSCVTYSPDGTRIATCSNNGAISVWDAAADSDSGKPPLPLRLLGSFDCHAGAVLCIAFSPDGNVLLSGNANLSVTFPGNLRSYCRERRHYRPFLDARYFRPRRAFTACNQCRSYCICADSGICTYGRNDYIRF